jgi:hypothetical protein
MVGEALREAAVLTAVFSILDKLVQGHEITVKWGLGVGAVAFGLFIAGLMFERLRDI